jgi:predicted NodU family carbamoyl transferase
LVISGGCALNILGISAIKRNFPEFNIFVDPIAVDATQSIGMSIHLYNNIRKNVGLTKKENKFDSIYLGPEYDLEITAQKIYSFVRQNDSSNREPI